MWTDSLPIIFAPVNTSTAARPCRRYCSRSTASDTTKYNERRPNIANTFELYTMSGFRVIANTAGTESSAKTISVVSTDVLLIVGDRDTFRAMALHERARLR